MTKTQREMSAPVKQKSHLKALRLQWQSSHVTIGLSVTALIVSVSLQFTSHISQLFGTSVSAVSGATILSVSVVFTGLAFIAAYFQVRLSRQREEVMDEISDTTDLIRRGQKLAAFIERRGDRMHNAPPK